MTYADAGVDLADDAQRHLEAGHVDVVVVEVLDARLGERAAQRLDGHGDCCFEGSPVGATAGGRHEAAPLFLGEQLELPLVLGESGDQLDHGRDGQLAAGRDLARAPVDRLFARDVDLGRTTTARLLPSAGHDEARLGKHVEVVAGDVGMQPERLGGVAGTHGFARGAQPLVDPGPRRHGQGALDGVVRLGVGGWSGHGQHGLFGRWARCTSFAVLARSAPRE